MKKIHSVSLILLAVLTLLSLALNGVVIAGLVWARQIALDGQLVALNAVSDARSMVTGVSDDTFSYTFAVQQQVPVETSVPFNEQVSVPIRTTVPISTVVIIPVDAGLLGTFNVDVPVRTMIPVNLDVTIPISHTVDIATMVSLDLDVPIEVPLAETPLVGYMEELDAGLASLEESLAQLGKRLAVPFSRGED